MEIIMECNEYEMQQVIIGRIIKDILQEQLSHGFNVEHYIQTLKGDKEQNG
jgi:hypothetical protein